MTQPAMDANAFAEMKELMGDTFKDVIALCLQTLPQQLNAIETAIEEHNAETLFLTAHKMKSSCGSIGAFGLADKAQAIELIGRDGSTQIPADTLVALQNTIKEVLSVLTTELEN